jgi:hypothetical protein
MGLLANWRRSLAKSRLIRSATAHVRAGQLEVAVEEIWGFISVDPVFARVLQHFAAGRHEISKAIQGMMMGGAGQTFRGHFVPVSALLFPDTLAYVLRAERGQVPRIAAYFELVEYFRKREMVFRPERAFHTQSGPN